MLDEQDEQIFAMTDAIAERARKIGGTTLRSVGRIGRLRRILDNDADFVWRGIGVNYYTGAFSVRFGDSTSYWLQSARIYYLNIINSAASPYPIWPEIILPAGGRIMIDIADQSGASNTLEIIFRGCKRFRIPQQS